MLVLPDYIIHEQVCTRENGKVEIYRGYSAVHKTPVIIKVFKQESATPADISKFVNEYVLTRELEIKSIVKPARLVASENYFAMVFDEDDESISLKKYCRETPMELPVFLDIAIQLTKAVGELHQDGIIHRNLRPENISINPSTREIKISNFSLATRFPSKGEVNPPSWDISVNTGLENLQYMSPEQLGIVKDIIDHRSDYYSLGVIFYEMLTGRLPFQGASHAEWIRVHATQKPEAPDKINPGIPTPLSAIILKLLSKTASERYHTAYNLLDDLKECKRQWDNTGKIEPFDIESGNLSRILELPRRIFGREAEIKELKTSLGLACEGRGKLVLLSGYAGTGKTKLINEIIMPAAMEKGYYGYGKFNQYNHGMPYKPVIDALGSIVRQVMTESRENLESWRSEILRALGRSGSVITELIPEVEMIIGRQPSVEPLQPKEAQNRFLILFGNFLKVFTERNAPVVIFLDDLQWADTASLHLLKYLCEYTDMNHLLIIGAHRSNEIHENHPLWATIEELQKKRIPLHEIYISSFNMKEVTEYLAEAFKCHYRNDDLNTLAEMLYRKTCGNPFFLRQMIETAYEERLVTFNIHNNCWQWDMDSIQKLCMPDDVVGLIHLKLQKLPGETLDILKHASCMGSTFDMKILSVACKKTYVEAYSLLLPAIMEGLVLPVSHSGKVLQASYNYNIVDINEFLHDKIRQAVYSLFSEKDKKETHVKIGRLILQNFYTDESDENIMTIMDHFNRGLELITDPGERLKLAGYNLQAGKKAKSASAYDSAIAYFTAGISLLPGDAWDSCYNLCFELHLGCAKCEYMLGNMDKVEKLLDLIISRAGTGQEKLDLYGMKMMLYAGTGKYSEAVQIGTDVLGKLGMKLPAKPGILDYFKELLFYKWHMRGKKAEDLYKLPEMKDPVQKKVAEFLVRIILTSCTDYPDLYSFAIIKIGNHALKYGNTEIASAGYIGYSIVEGSVFNNYEKGYEIGKVVIALAEKYNKSFLKCLVYFTHGALLYHWTNHAKGAFKYLQKAINCANEAGNVLLAGYSYGVILEKKYLLGTSLEKVLALAQKYRKHAETLKHENLRINALAYMRAASILTSQADTLSSPVAGDTGEEKLLKSVKGDKSSLIAYYYTQMQLCYLAGNYREALVWSEKIKTCAGVLLGFLMSAEYNFYHSLSITAIHGEIRLMERKKLMKELKKNQRQMKKWSDSCKENFLHKYLLVEAEKARILGRKQEAVILYDKAIQSAGESGYIQNKAIACELAAKFYAAQGWARIAKTYLNDAFDSYIKWGATAKAQDIKLRYPDLLDMAVVKESEGKDYDPEKLLKNILYSSIDMEGKTVGNLDIHMHNVQNAINYICQQQEIDKLFTAFLGITIESSCANKGYLMLKKGNELFIEAEKDSKNSSVIITNSIPLEQRNNLSKTIIRYAARTLEPVIVNNKGQTGIFIKDPYLAKPGEKSIVCIPLQFQGTPVGVLYLENDLMPEVFTKSRINFISLLANLVSSTKTLQEFMEKSGLQIKEETTLHSLDTFTGKEIEVLRLISSGLSNKEIAERLDISINTVKTHVKNIYEKLHVNRRVQAVEKAKRLKVL